MIQINHLKFEYPMSGFELNIERLVVEGGEKVAVVGPSGSGKTTLLNLISGICVPDAGKIEVHDTVVSDLGDSDRRNFRIQRIGSVFQQFELVEYLSVRENILFPYLINNSLNIDGMVRQRVEELAGAVGIDDKLNRRVTSLSQGEQQRVAICRAILPRPKLILADEPTGNLDPTNKRKILELLFGQCAENNLTLVAVTHDLNILQGFNRTIDFEDFRCVGSQPGEAII